MTWNYRRPLPGSIEEAAQKIERLMELEEQQRRRPAAYRGRPEEPSYVPRNGLLAAIAMPHGSSQNPSVVGGIGPLRAPAPVKPRPMSRLVLADAGPSVGWAPSAPQLADAEGDTGAPAPIPLLEGDPFDHYRFGDGMPRSIPISALTLNAPVELTEFPGVRTILAGQQVGTFQIDENADFEVVGDYDAALGGVSVNLKGQLSVHPNGTYDFQGDYGIEPDRYDFDSKPWGQRDLPAEVIVRLVDTFVSGTPFVNHVLGRLPVRERGAR